MAPQYYGQRRENIILRLCLSYKFHSIRKIYSVKTLLLVHNSGFFIFQEIRVVSEGPLLAEAPFGASYPVTNPGS